MKTARPPSWQILLAFAIIYFVWGSTFLAIRVGVRECPPFLLAAVRFLAAGLILYVWMRLKGSPSLTSREWAGIVSGHAHLRGGLRMPLLGGAACSFRNRGGHTGDHSCVHH